MANNKKRWIHGEYNWLSNVNTIITGLLTITTFIIALATCGSATKIARMEEMLQKQDSTNNFLIKNNDKL